MDDGRQLRIAIVGGVFDRSDTYRSAVRWTPETVLVEGLGDRGHHVEAMGHSRRFSSSEFDIVHVHHLSWGALRAATDPSKAPFLFTLHAGTPAHPAAAAYVLRRVDGAVALWPDQADVLARTSRLNGAEVAVIPNGVDPAVFPFREPTHPGSDPWRLLYVGQLIALKRVDRLLRAVALLRKRYDVELDLSYHVAIEEAALRALTQELGLGAVARFLGPARQEELAKRYWSSHIVVLPSTIEALPSVLTEAMLTGRYPVATDVGGIRYQLDGFGIVIPRSTPAEIAQGIERAVLTYGEHCGRARRMREAAKTRFSTEAMVSSHEALYRRLADGRKPRRFRPGLVTIGTHLGRPALECFRPLRERDPNVGSRV